MEGRNEWAEQQEEYGGGGERGPQASHVSRKWVSVTMEVEEGWRQGEEGEDGGGGVDDWTRI